MFSYIRTKLANYFRRKNRERRTASRLRRLKAYDATTKNKQAIPEIIRRVLLISTSEGWGDSLYVAGLAQRLKENGVEAVCLMAPETILEHFDNPVFNVVGSLEQESELGVVFSPDVLVDLTYIGICCGKERLHLIKQLSCPAVTVSEICCDLNAYSIFVAYRKKAHISERMALVLSALTHHDESPIIPIGYASEDDKNHAHQIIEELFPEGRPAHMTYLNTVARDLDRSFTAAQRDILVQVLLKNGFDGIILNSNVFCAILDERVRRLPKMTFHELTALIEQMDLVVTPDTSITHLAAFYDIPCFVVFPPNDRDYWGEYSAKDSWGALSTQNITYSHDDENLSIDPFGYASIRSRACASYEPFALADALDKFVVNIYCK